MPHPVDRATDPPDLHPVAGAGGRSSAPDWGTRSMSNQTQARAQAALPELQSVTAVVLPEPAAELARLDDAPAEVAAEIRRRMDEIDLHDTAYGTRAFYASHDCLKHANCKSLYARCIFKTARGALRTLAKIVSLPNF